MSPSWQKQMVILARSCLHYYSPCILATLTFYWPYDIVGTLHSRSSHLSSNMVITITEARSIFMDADELCVQSDKMLGRGNTRAARLLIAICHKNQMWI